jgi:hypothetical protein
MNRTLALIFGLTPAALMTVMALVGIGFLENWRLLLVPAAVIGFVGMVWAFTGYVRNRAPLVLAMLVVGEAAMAWGLFSQLADLFSPQKEIGWKIFSMWATLGPCAVGAVYIWRALTRNSPVSPNTSLERTRGR